MNKNFYTSSAIASGGLLAIMTFLNGELARYTSPAWSSLIAHFVGIFGSWFLWRLMTKRRKMMFFSSDAPLWSYLGGVFGAMIVMLANITVNSSIGLVGSFSLMILGQTFFALLFDYRGWFGMESRSLRLHDFVQVSSILAGSILIVAY